jgi:Interleukin-17
MLFDVFDDVRTPETVSNVDSSASQSRSPRIRRWTTMNIATLQSVTANLQNRSICPWTYVYNVDLARNPSAVLQAQCMYTTVPGTSMQCEHVYYYVPVKKNVAGTIQDQWLKMKVGCTLAVPPTVYQPPITTS